MDIIIQLIGLFALIAGTVWAYRQWVHPRSTNWLTRGLLLLLVVVMMGGLIGSTGWWTDDPRSFSWDLPPLASRMLAAAGCAFGAAMFMTLQKPTHRRVRLALLALLTYLAPLLVVIPLFHLDRFDPNAPITYAFFILVILLVVWGLWYIVRQPDILPDDAIPTTPSVRIWLTVVAVVMAVWSIALFVTDSGFSPLVWVWPGDLLTSRLIAVMLLTLAVGAVYSRNYADPARVMLVMIAVYGVGVLVAALINLLNAKPPPVLYAVMFTGSALISGGLLLAGRRDNP